MTNVAGKIPRREALAMIGAAGLTVASPSWADRRTTGAAPPAVSPGLELYTISEALGPNLAETLRAVARIGYREIELPPVFTSPVADRRLIYRARADWPFIKGVFDQAGLRCRSIHVLPQKFPGFDGPTIDDDLAEQIEFAQYLGASFIVCTAARIPDRLMGDLKHGLEKRITDQLTLDDWKLMADYLNGAARVAERSGLTIAYHNHHLEFRRFGETTAFDELIRRTDPGVKIEMDCGHLMSAGHDAVAYLDKYPGRFPLLHVKDISIRGHVFDAPTKSTEIGRGIMDWPAIFRAAYRSGLVQYYVEEDGPYSRPPLERIQISYDYLSSLAA